MPATSECGSAIRAVVRPSRAARSTPPRQPTYSPAGVDPVEERLPPRRPERVRRRRRYAVRDEQHVEVREGAGRDLRGGHPLVGQVPHLLEQVAQPAGRFEPRRAARDLVDARRAEAGPAAAGRPEQRAAPRARLKARARRPERPPAHVEEQRVAPAADVIEVGERHVRVLVQQGLDPVLLHLRHRDPVGARRQHRSAPAGRPYGLKSGTASGAVSR